MLSRTADHLYWMSRYMERAENIARFLDVASHLSLTGGGRQSLWQPVLTISGGQQPYTAAHGEVAADKVVAWTVLDGANSSSILSCLQATRENAQAVRSVIPHELWAAINATWLESQAFDTAGLREYGLPGLCDWVKERSHLTRGAIYGTMVRDEAFHFLRLGTFLERADNTARLLITRPDGISDHIHWGAVLRAAGAIRAYRSLFKGDVTPEGTAEMLILMPDMPRSLHTCMDMVYDILLRLCPSCECTLLASESHAELHSGRLDILLRNGLGAFVTRFVNANTTLAARIHADFMMPI